MTTNLNIAIAGLGTVGASVVAILQQNEELLKARTGKSLNITAVSARDKNKDRNITLPPNVQWCENALELCNSEADVIVELIGGDGDVAYKLGKRALEAGKHLVTANKALIAKHGAEFATIAEQKNITLAFEAAVAGGIPIIKTLKEGLVANNVSSIKGIMNGTCNYILSTMEKTGKKFGNILNEAQKLGYAEADPTFDIEGTDTAHKLAILTAIAFAVKPDYTSMHIEGITHITVHDIRYAAELGYKIKLLGICCKNEQGFIQRVHPCLIPSSHPLAAVDGVDNAIYIEGNFIGKLLLQGPGAGGSATASSVVSDIADIATGRSSYAFNCKTDSLKQVEFMPVAAREGAYYIRILVEDKSGVLAHIAEEISDQGISMQSILQKSAKSGENVNIVGITHITNEQKMAAAIRKISKIDGVLKFPSMIRIET